MAFKQDIPSIKPGNYPVHSGRKHQDIPSIKPGNYHSIKPGNGRKHQAPITIADHLSIEQQNKLNIPPTQTQNSIQNPIQNEFQIKHKDKIEQYAIHGIPPIKWVEGGRQQIEGNYFTWIDEFDGQPLQAFFPYDGDVDEFETKMADLRIAPDLSHDYKWDCQSCGAIQYAPKSLLMSAKDSEFKDCKPELCQCQKCLKGTINHKFTTTIPCSECQHRGLAMTECQYPECWWKMFCRTDATNIPTFCSYHKDHDPEHIKDILNQCVKTIENDGKSTYWGGQAFLNQVKLIDDYDFEYNQYLNQTQKV